MIRNLNYNIRVVETQMNTDITRVKKDADIPIINHVYTLLFIVGGNYRLLLLVLVLVMIFKIFEYFVSQICNK